MAYNSVGAERTSRHFPPHPRKPPMSRLHRAIFILLFPLFCVASAAKAGEAAPPMAFDKIYNAPAGQSTSWGAFKGELVVVDFWATWCGPCIASFPHVRELAKELTGEPIRFVFVSIDDDIAALEKFLAASNLPGWVCSDPRMSVAKAFGVSSFPTTVLISPKGELLGYCSTSELTADLLRTQAKQDVPLPFLKSNPGVDFRTSAEERDSAQDFVRITVSRSTGREPAMSSSPSSGLVAKQVTASYIYRELTGLHPTRFRGAVPSEDMTIDVSVWVRDCKSWTALYETSQSAVDAAFGVVSQKVKRAEEVTVLTIPDPWPSGLLRVSSDETESGIRWEKGVLKIRRVFPFSLGFMLANRLSVPVEIACAEGSRAIPFDAELTLPESYTGEELLEAMVHQWGLKRSVEIREIDVLMFEPAKPDPTH